MVIVTFGERNENLGMKKEGGLKGTLRNIPQFRHHPSFHR
jgi:hypothetical protein